VSWDATAKALTINSAYVESVANTPITVGDIGAVPEPSSALLALAGVGAAALRRRRKQAA
jgi:MYXO-CTERM domain-containing protein